MLSTIVTINPTVSLRSFTYGHVDQGDKTEFPLS